MRTVHIGVLALQGAFREHAAALASLGADVTLVRKPEQVRGLQGLVLPGGESTTMGTLLVQWHLLEAIQEQHQQGMALLGTCAGLILLCKDIEASDQPRLGLLDATVRRNAFGRQVDSFVCPLPLGELNGTTAADGQEEGDFPAVFIRAPVLTKVGNAVKVLATLRGKDGEERAVAVRQERVLGLSFHPELTGDKRVHSGFLDMCCA